MFKKSLMNNTWFTLRHATGSHSDNCKAITNVITRTPSAENLRAAYLKITPFRELFDRFLLLLRNIHLAGKN